jgi:hypothetical protein
MQSTILQVGILQVGEIVKVEVKIIKNNEVSSLTKNQHFFSNNRQNNFENI